MENQNNSSYEEELEIDLGSYARIIWKRKKAISSIVILAIIIALIVSFSLPKVYQSSSIVKLGQLQGGIIEAPSTTIEIFKQPTILKELAQKLDISSLSIASKFKIIDRGGILEINGFDDTPTSAQKTANVISDAVLKRYENIFKDIQTTQQLEIDALKNIITDLDKEIEPLEKQILTQGKTVSEAQARIVVALISSLENKKIQQKSYQKDLIKKQQELISQTFASRIEVSSSLPVSPIKPNKRLILILGAVIGLFAAILYAFLAEYVRKQKIENSK